MVTKQDFESYNNRFHKCRCWKHIEKKFRICADCFHTDIVDYFQITDINGNLLSNEATWDVFRYLVDEYFIENNNA